MAMRSSMACMICAIKKRPHGSVSPRSRPLRVLIRMTLPDCISLEVELVVRAREHLAEQLVGVQTFYARRYLCAALGKLALSLSWAYRPVVGLKPRAYVSVQPRNDFRMFG